MIVVDTDVIAAYWILTPRTADAMRARRKDPDWITPVLWRSEFRSVLRQHMQAGGMRYSDAVWIAEKAERTMFGKEYEVLSTDVLRLVERTGHSSYDCEYVALAETAGLRLVTGDRELPRTFPSVAVLLEDFVR